MENALSFHASYRICFYTAHSVDFYRSARAASQKEHKTFSVFGHPEIWRCCFSPTARTRFSTTNFVPIFACLKTGVHTRVLQRSTRMTEAKIYTRERRDFDVEKQMVAALQILYIL